MKTKYIGHRGAKGEKPENTLLGIKHALNLGCDGVEIDVHISKDGHLIVIHDESLDRTTDKQGLVSQLSLKEIKKCNAGMGETIPTLSEVIDLMKGCNKELMIELKVPDIEAEVLKAIKEKDFSELSIIKSFNHRSILNFKKIFPSIRAQVLIDCLPINPLNIIKSAKADGLSIKIKFLDNLIIEQCHNEGFFVTTWNANNRDDLKKYSLMGTDYVCTDLPSLIL